MASNPLSLMDIVAQFEAEHPEASTSPSPAAPPAPPRPASPVSALRPIPPFGDGVVKASDIQKMVAEAQKSVQLRSGLVGAVLTRLKGDEFRNRQYQTMLARIDIWDTTEENKLAMMLIVSLQVLAFKVVVAGLEDMEAFLDRLGVGRVAHDTGRELIQHFQDQAKQFTFEVTSGAAAHAMDALGHGR